MKFREFCSADVGRDPEMVESAAWFQDESDISMNTSRASGIGVADWKELVAEFQQPSVGRATWQIVNSLGSYILLWVLMGWSQTISWWLTLPLAILAGGLLVRVFIIFHDCGHGSFLKSRLGNDIDGFVAGLMTFTPYYHWRWEHALHHG